MSFVYVTDQGAKLSVDGGYFVITTVKGVVKKVPKEAMESLVFFGKSSITSQAISNILVRHIPVSFFSKTGMYYGRLVSTTSNNVFRLRKQLKLTEDKKFCMIIAKNIIKAKIHNQRVVLSRYQKNSLLDIGFVINQIHNFEKKVEGAKSIEEVMGYEGIASRYYFKGISIIINPDFAFEGRSKRPPKDPFNSMISLGYTILMHEIYGLIENRGLSPYAGILHRDRENHPTLASDLMEEWRSVIVDSTALSLIQNNKVSVDDFIVNQDNGGVTIKPEAMKVYIQALEKKMELLNKYLSYLEMQSAFRRSIWHQVNQMRLAFEENDATRYDAIWIR